MTTLLFSTLLGCSQPAHLQADHGRAYHAALTTQANLARASALHADYPLSGEEGIALRQRVIEESTDQETGQAEYTETIGVE